MSISATEFKATCLAVIDRVSRTGEPVVITKRGRAVARLIPEVDQSDRPWLALRGTTAAWQGSPFLPAIEAGDVEALA